MQVIVYKVNKPFNHIQVSFLLYFRCLFVKKNDWSSLAKLGCQKHLSMPNLSLAPTIGDALMCSTPITRLKFMRVFVDGLVCLDVEYQIVVCTIFKVCGH